MSDAEPTFFIDRCLGARFPNALETVGIRVVLHRDHFVDTAPDEEWLAWVAEQGYVALSNDRNVYRRPAQREAVLRAQLAYFVLSANAKTDELARAFIDSYPKVKQLLIEQPLPFIASIQRPSAPGRSGRISLLYPRDD
ncbi:MAG: hypothetical protein AAGG50_11400 [Bacteroidota bacterium]